MTFIAMHSRREDRLPVTIRRMARTGVVMLSAAGLVMGCGGEPAESTDTAAAQVGATASEFTNACTLLPATEVTAVLGETVRDSLALSMPDASGAVSLSQCNYATASNPAAVSLMLRRSPPGDISAGSLQTIRETMEQSGTTAENVPGLGEGALWGGNQLHVITNKGWAIVVSPLAAGGLAQARTIAERALARM
jgi:hypothetical protein